MNFAAKGPSETMRRTATIAALGLSAGVILISAVFPGALDAAHAASAGLLGLVAAACLVLWPLPRRAEGVAVGDLRVNEPMPPEIRESFGRLGGVALCLSEADGRLTVVGRDAERIVGLAPSDYPRGTATCLRVKGEYRDKVDAAARDFDRSGQIVDLEYGAVDQRSGCDRWIAETSAALGNGRKLTVYFDRSSEHDAEQKTELAALLVEAAKRGRASFLANIDHEFRTPLNTIIGFSEIIQTEVLGPIGNDRYKGYVGDIHASGKLLLTLVDRLLDLARAETGTLALEEEDSDLKALVVDCGQLMRQAAERAGIKLGIECSENMPHVYADHHKLKRALLLLLDNAVKFTLSGGSVVISAEMAADGGLALAISDDGVGIPPGDIGRLVDAEPGRHGQKVGLGLPLARRLAELHGGRLEITTGRERGTVVRIVLPAFRVIARPESKQAKAAEAAPAAGNVLPVMASAHRRVLCVDPDPVIPRVIRQCLRSAGDRSEILWRDTVAAGLDAARSLKPDIVLVDWHLPDVSDVSLAEALRAEPDLREIPVAYLSDIEFDRQIDDARPDLAHRWLIKTDLTAANVKAALASAVAATQHYKGEKRIA